MFTYPFENNIIKVFFTMAAEMLQANSIAELTLNLTQIESYKAAYALYNHHFADDNRAAIEDRPTAEQKELHQSELHLIDTLSMIYAYKMLCFKDANSTQYAEPFKQHRSRLAQVELSSHKLKSSLASLLNRYVCLASNSIQLLDKLDVMTFDEVSAYINSGAKLIDAIYSFEYDPVLVKEVDVPHVPAELVSSFINGIQIAKVDQEETNTSVETTVFKLINNIYVFNMIRVRRSLPYHEKGSGVVTDKQRICDLKSQIDAVAKLLNLSGFLDYRELYESHFAKHTLQQRFNQSARHYYQDRFPVLSSFININKLDHDINAATQLLFKHLEIAESLVHMVLLLEESGNSILHLKPFLLNYVDNINFDTKILIPLAAACAKRNPASEYDPEVNMIYLKNALRMSATLMYMVDKDNHSGMNAAICTAQADITPLGCFGNSNIASLYALMMQTKYNILVKDGASAPIRAYFLAVLAGEIRNLYAQFQEISPDLTEINLAAQFIIDIYLYGLFTCRNLDEINIIMQDDIVTSMYIIQSGVNRNNKKANEYLIKILYEYKKPEVLLRYTRNADVLALDAAQKKYLNVLALHSMQCLYTGKTITDYHEFGNLHCRMSSVIEVIFLKFVGRIARQLLEIGETEEKKNAAIVLIKLNNYVQLRIDSATKVLDRLSFEKTSYRPAGFLSEAKVDSFLPDNLKNEAKKPVKKKTKGGKKNKGGKSRQEVAATHTHSEAELVWEYEKVESYFGARKNELISFYRNGLDNRKPDAKLYALAGSVRTLLHFTNKEKEKEFAKNLEIQADYILKQARLLPKTERNLTAVREYTEGMEAWQLANRPVVKQVDKPVVRIKKEPVVTCTMTLFSTTVHRTAPRPRVENTDTYAEMREHYPLDMEETPTQAAVLDELANAGMEPIAHGGRVFDKLFGIKPGDLDVLCIAKDVAAVVSLLNRRKSDLKIKDIHEIESENVLIIKFDGNAIGHPITRKTDLRLELYVVTATSGKSAAIIHLARRYGITFIGYEWRGQDIIDPVKLFSKLQQTPPQLDAHLLAVDIKSYLSQYPVRILDMFKRIARCRNADKTLELSPILSKAVSKRKSALVEPLEKFAMEKFNRLFMQGYARIVYNLLVEYDCLRYLFPMLDTEDYPSLLAACEIADTTLSMLDIDLLPDSELEKLRATFFSNAFYTAFIRSHDINHYRENAKQFYIDANHFIASLPFETRYSDCSVMVNLIQDDWLGQMNEALCYVDIPAKAYQY